MGICFAYHSLIKYMLDTLISSKTRLKLLVKLFLNPNNRAHLRGLADEFEESTNAVRVELNRFEEAGMLTSETKGNRKLYRANAKHALFDSINNLLLQYIGADRIIESILNRMGTLEMAYLTGDYANGRDSGIIDLILIGDIDKSYLSDKVSKAEVLIKKKIRYLIYSLDEWNQRAINTSEIPDLLLWQRK